MDEIKRLIVNADDFGFSEAVNNGILKAHKEGIVTSTTIMANMPGFEHAVTLAKENPTLRIGVHMNLTCYKPILQGHQTLVNKAGIFDKDNKETYSEYEAYEELCAQIEKVLASGIIIDHLDTHHHIHTEPWMKRILEKILRKYPYPVRGGFTYPNDYPYQSILLEDFYGEGVSFSSLEKIIMQLEPGKIYDLMCHPAILDNPLMKLSSYTYPRKKELKLLCKEKTRKMLEMHQIELVTYNCF